MIKNLILITVLSSSALAQVTIQPPPREVPGRPVPPVPVPPPKPQPPPPPTVSEQEITHVARNVGTRFAEDILNSYGVVSQIRFNFRQGISSQRRLMGDFDQPEVVRSSNIYLQNIGSGKGQGATEGEAQGQRDANSVAYNLVNSDISAAIDEAINTGKPIRFVQNPRSTSYSGARANLTGAGSVLSQMLDDKSQIRSQLERYTQAPVSRSFIDSYLNVESMYREEWVNLPSDLDGRYSFREWRNGGWNSSYSSYRSEHQRGRNMFTEIGQPKYPLHSRYQEIFSYSFHEGYVRMINSWSRVIQQHNQGADTVGRDAYMKAANDYARLLGYNEGYSATYTPASVKSFGVSILPAYKTIYPQQEAWVRNNSNVVRPQIEIVDVKTGQQTGTMGDFINIKVNTLTNRGMQEAQVDIEVQSNEQVRGLKKVSMQAKGLSKLAKPVVHEFMAQIEEVTAAYQTIPVKVIVGNETYALQIRATWEELIHSAGSIQNNPAYVQRLGEKMRDFLAQEWATIENNQYTNNDPETLLMRLHTYYRTQPQEVRAQLSSLGRIISPYIGEEPSRVFSNRHDDWNTARDRLREIGML